MLEWTEDTFVKGTKIQSWQELVKFKFWLTLTKLRVVKDNGLFRNISSIDQSINNWSISSIKLLINQSSMGIYWWLGLEKRRKNSGWGSETLSLPSWVGRNGPCVYLCVSVCVLAFVYMNARVWVCVYVCVCVCVCVSVYVLCVSLTWRRPCAIKMHGRLLKIIILVLTSKL